MGGRRVEAGAWTARSGPQTSMLREPAAAPTLFMAACIDGVGSGRLVTDPGLHKHKKENKKTEIRDPELVFRKHPKEAACPFGQGDRVCGLPLFLGGKDGEVRIYRS